MPTGYKRLTATAFAACVLAACSAYGPHPFVPQTASVDEPVVSVPLTESRNFFTVPVVINGKGPFTFQIDTGSTWVIVSAKAAQLANLPPANVRAVDVFVNGRQFEWPHGIAQVDSLKIGSADFQNLVVRVAAADDPILQPSNAPPGSNFDGILGFSVLRKLPVTLDMPQKQLHIWQRSPLENIPRNDPSLRPLRSSDSVPEITLTVAKGQPAEIGTKVVLDTGCWLPLVLPPALSTAFDPPEILGEAGTRTYYGAPIVRLERHRTPIEYPGMVLANNVLVFNSDGPVYAMGVPLLRHYAITFDAPNELIRMELTDPPPPRPDVKLTTIDHGPSHLD
jgi:hypothetical protein